MAGSGIAQRVEPPTVKRVAELAETGGARECLQWFTAQKQWINEQHLELCRIPAPTFREQQRAEWMAGRFRAIGCDARLDRAGNVVAFLNVGREGPLVALTAHLDTVLEPRGPDDIHVGVDGRYHGPGVADNGAGLAALLAVAHALKASGLGGKGAPPFVFVATVGEEGEGNLSGMRYLCRSSGLAARTSAFLVLDGPATDHVTWRALASRRFEIALHGPGGHSWSDYGIGNPVHALSRAIARFTDEQELVAGSGPDFSFNFGVIEGGASVNSIPASALAKLDIRSESIERLEELAQLLAGSVERALEWENSRATGGRLTAKVREIGFRPGGQLAEDAPLLRCIRAVDRYLGNRTHPDCASTDANIPLSIGIQALSIGAGGQGGGAHTPAEWYHPEGRELGLKRILLTMLLAAAPPAP